MTYEAKRCIACYHGSHPEGRCSGKVADYAGDRRCRCDENLVATSQLEEDYLTIRQHVAYWDVPRIDRLWEAARSWDEHQLLMSSPH